MRTSHRSGAARSPSGQKADRIDRPLHRPKPILGVCKPGRRRRRDPPGVAEGWVLAPSRQQEARASQGATSRRRCPDSLHCGRDSPRPPRRRACSWPRWTGQASRSALRQRGRSIGIAVPPLRTPFVQPLSGLERQLGSRLARARRVESACSIVSPPASRSGRELPRWALPSALPLRGTQPRLPRRPSPTRGTFEHGSNTTGAPRDPSTRPGVW